MIRRQRIHRGLQCPVTKFVLLRRQRPLSKWDRRKADPGPTRANPDVHVVRNE